MDKFARKREGHADRKRETYRTNCEIMAEIGEIKQINSRFCAKLQQKTGAEPKYNTNFFNRKIDTMQLLLKIC